MLRLADQEMFAVSREHSSFFSDNCKAGFSTSVCGHSILPRGDRSGFGEAHLLINNTTHFLNSFRHRLLARCVIAQARVIDTPPVLDQLGNSASQAYRAHRKFIDDGRGLGHDDRYYEVVDQRFLGDENFIGQIAERAQKGEIIISRRKQRFEKLLPAVAQVHGCEVSDLSAAGRQRAWAKPRAQPAYLARHWCAMKAIEIARRLHRDASMISRLCASYEGARDTSTEKKIAELIAK